MDRDTTGSGTVQLLSSVDEFVCRGTGQSMSEWQLIATAPKDGSKVDLFAKVWRSHNDTFTGERFPNCYWSNGDHTCNRKPAWEGLPNGWYPTHWRPIPYPPEAS
jgi:hypothetical protein